MKELLMLLLLNMGCSQDLIEANGMIVKWRHQDDRVYFDLYAPTGGWLAIGFNETPGLKDTYLIMGHVTNRKTTVQEHYVLAPGDYRTFDQLREPISVMDISGSERNGETRISFSLPESSFYQYTKNLKPGTEFHLLMAYSVADDFKHHSRMRTSIKIKL